MNGGIRRLILSGSVCAFCTLCALLAVTAQAAGNRWTAIGPDGANVVAMVVDQRTPATVFAGTQGSGILKSTDGGMTWATANNSLPTLNVAALAMDPVAPSTVYASTDAGVFKSVDGGGNWSAANIGFGNAVPVSVSSFVIDPHASNTVYAATPGGLFKSVDGAASWTLSFSMPALTPRIVAIDPATSSTIYVACDDYVFYSRGGVFKSVDAGSTWTRVFTAPIGEEGQSPFSAFVIDPNASSSLYLVIDGGILHSADGGTSWAGISGVGRFAYSVTLDAARPGTIYGSSTAGGIFRTADAGSHWTLISDGSLVPAAIIALNKSAPDTIYVGGSTGIYISSDGGLTWTRRALGVRSGAVYPVTAHPTSPFIIYSARNAAVQRTTDGGGHWFRLIDSPALDWVGFILVDPVHPSTIYVGGTGVEACDDACPPLYRSDDGGAHWTPASVGLYANSLQALAIAPSRSATLYTGSNVGVGKSVDGGRSWKVTTSLGMTVYEVYVTAVAVDPTTADTVYAATGYTGRPNSEPKLFKSTDGGLLWTQTRLSVPSNALITSVAIDRASPATIYATYAQGFGREGGVFKSVDAGASWTQAQSGMTDTTWVMAMAIDPVVPNLIFAATREGVFMSTDAAAHWVPINDGLPDLDIWGISMDETGSHLRVVSGAGMFEYGVASLPPPSSNVPVIEYVHSGFGHYFMTSSPDEIDKLDGGVFPGWSRSGFQFNADAVPNAQSAPVCRFFTTAFGPKSSHFYTPFGFECAITKTDPHWQLESAAAFFIGVPDVTGSCGAGLLPVYRLYNNFQGGAPNHRYTTDLTVRAQMIAQGWLPEGRGPDAVQMCSPQ